MSDGFGAEHLPYGVIRPRGGAPRLAVRLGDAALDLTTLELPAPPEVFASDSLNAFMALGPDTWRDVRAAIAATVASDPETIPLGECAQMLPVRIGDYVDFYSSLHHAQNLGRMFRPDQEPLLPNWRQIPVGYHGRSGTVVVSGTEVARPSGLVPGEDGVARLTPTRALDIELEVGFVIGAGSDEPVAPDAADRHVFGIALVNDWSARDIQAFEYQPLGPFLGKSFATSMAAWVTPLAALSLVPAPPQDPSPDPYLRASRSWGLDLQLAVDLNGTRICRTGFADMYWTFAQQLAHMTVNGATTRPGDLFASGTVSGASRGERGSLIEATWRGTEPLVLDDGSERTYLEDGDTVVLSGGAGAITLAGCAGTITRR